MPSPMNKITFLAAGDTGCTVGDWFWYVPVVEQAVNNKQRLAPSPGSSWLIFDEFIMCLFQAYAFIYFVAIHLVDLYQCT